MNGRLARNILWYVSIISYSFCGFFDNSTAYSSVSMSTPYVNDKFNIDDDYRYSFGIRKIALFPYQIKGNFYKGDEAQLSDNALFGAVDGLEYLISASKVRNQGHEYTDQEYWIKWSKNSFVTKFKYLDKGSRDLQFTSIDARYKVSLGSAFFSFGGNVMAHPIYGHPAYNDYDGYWFELAWDYGYEDFEVPEFDLNQNGIIDDPYYVWVETDPETLDGYWILFYEGTSYYWEDPDGNYVAGSDQEFEQYHMQEVINQYNKDNKDKEWQAEVSFVVGLDVLLGGDKFYSHTWVNIFPKSYGITDKAYDGDEMQYDIGVILGTNLSEHIGVFIEGSCLKYYGREEYNVSTGLNWRF